MNGKNFFGVGLGFLLSLLLVVFTAAPARAQLDTGSLGGTVTDATGGVIPGAQVTATEKQSGTVYKAVTTSSGSYVFPSLRPGVYDISASAPSFSNKLVSGLPIYVGTRGSQDLTLATGATTDTVTVVANGPSLETETSDIGTVITPEQVEDLPIAANGGIRSLIQLAFLVPGAVGPGTNGGTAFSKIGGGQTEGSDSLIDGISTQRSENGSGQSDQVTPSLEALEEFRVESFSLPAYLGRTTGGIANFKSKAGNNTYHGTVYDFYRNTIFDANNYFNKGRAAMSGLTGDSPNFRRGKDIHNDYGTTLGGPVYVPHIYNGHDKTFFFFSFENVPTGFTSGGAAAAITVPTLAQRQGDFSSYLGGPVLSGGTPVINPCTGQPLLVNQVFDPATTRTVNGVLCRNPFQNNKVPVGNSQVANKVLALIPLPNFTSTTGQNFLLSTNSSSVQTDFALRVDQNLGSRNHVYTFVHKRENYTPSAPNLPGPVNSGGNQSDLYGKQLRAGWDFSITPHIANNLNFGGNRINSFNNAPGAAQGINYDALLGIPNTPSAGTTFPIFNLGEGITGLGNNNFDDNVDNVLSLDDNVSLQKGAHTVRVGGTYRWQQFSYINNGPAAGTFSFSRAQTAGINTQTAQTGNSFASFLLGQPSNISRTLQLHFPRWIQTYVAGYVQDDWKAKKNLTLNLGFRYSYDTPRHEAGGNIASFDPTLPNPAANGILGAIRYGGVGTGRDGNKGETFANTYYKNFEPRVGFAYAPGWLNDKAVLRGAYTIMYGPLIYSDFGQGLSTGFTVTTPSANNDPFNAYGPLDAGPLNLPTTYTLDQVSHLNQGVDYVAPDDGKPAMVQNWSLETQTTLAPDLIFTLGYLGQHSTRLRSLVYYPNSLNPAYFALGDLLTASATSTSAQAAGVKIPFANFTSVTNGAVGQALLPYPQYGYINNDSYLQNRGQATYHALEAKVERRFRNGVNVLASYTWSKTLTDADSIQPFFATTLGQGGTQNPFNLKGEKAASTQDVPTNFVISYLYELPVGKGKKLLGNSNKLVNALVGGYRLGGIDRYVSGQPISFFGATGVPYFNGSIRFNRVPGQDIENPIAHSGHFNPFGFVRNNDPRQVNPTSFFNRAAFSDPNASENRGSGAFHFGNLPRNTTEVRTPAYFNEDANINKHFGITEQIGADLRLEVFNLFNRHVFGKPDSGVSNMTFGQVGGLNDVPRSMQVVLKIRY